MSKISYEPLGVKEILKNLGATRGKASKGIEAGLKAAGLHLQRESQRIVPVQFGILKNSAFTRHQGSGAVTKVFVGYTADYAVYVHENLTARHKRGKEAKFLEKPMREERGNMRIIISHRIRKSLGM